MLGVAVPRNYVVLDLDRAGALDEIEERFGPLPDTMTFTTRPGRSQRWYRIPDGAPGLRQGSGMLGILGLDTRVGGGRLDPVPPRQAAPGDPPGPVRPGSGRR